MPARLPLSVIPGRDAPRSRPRATRARVLFLLIAVACVGQGCVSTEVFDLRRDPTLADRTYRSLAVLCSSEAGDRGPAIEAAVTAELVDAGFDARAAHVLQREEPFRLADHPEIDALLWIGYGAYEKDVTHYPGFVTHELGWGGGYSSFHHGWGRRHHHHHGAFFGPSFSTTYSPPHDEVRWSLRTRVELIDAATERAVWSANVDAASGSPGLIELAEAIGEEAAGLLEDMGQVIATR